MKNIVSITLEDNWSGSISIRPYLFFEIIILISVVFFRSNIKLIFLRDVTIDRGEVGLGPGKINLRTDATDREIAHKIWVELKTRKIGLPIDFENDVNIELYDSWYAFFGDTRELIKGIPISKIGRDLTQEIVNLSIDVLNAGIRPHLWRANMSHQCSALS